jgi:citrate lyase beta subunit
VGVRLANLRSILFVPGSDERKLARALDSEADAVVADLEDAVAPAQKERARAVVVEQLRARRRDGLMVRINGTHTPYFEEDLRAIAGLDLAAVVLPKATPDAVARCGSGEPPLLAIVETAQGLRQAYELAASPRVAALLLGAADLGAELGLSPLVDSQELLFARSKLVVDAAAAGIRPPFDMVHLDVRDADALAAEAATARALGFGGKACIHPDQVEVVNRVFAPTAAELAWADEAIGAYEAAVAGGQGAVLVAGTLVDRAVVERARRIASRANGGDGAP